MPFHQCAFPCTPVTLARLRDESFAPSHACAPRVFSSQWNLVNRLDSSGRVLQRMAQSRANDMRSLVAPTERRPPAGSRFGSKTSQRSPVASLGKRHDDYPYPYAAISSLRSMFTSEE